MPAQRARFEARARALANLYSARKYCGLEGKCFLLKCLSRGQRVHMWVWVEDSLMRPHCIVDDASSHDVLQQVHDSTCLQAAPTHRIACQAKVLCCERYAHPKQQASQASQA